MERGDGKMPMHKTKLMSCWLPLSESQRQEKIYVEGAKIRAENPNLNVTRTTTTTTTTFELRLAETGNSIYDNRTEGIFHIQLS